MHNKKLSYRRETSWRSKSVYILLTAAQPCEKNNIWKRFSAGEWPWWTLKLASCTYSECSFSLIIVSKRMRCHLVEGWERSYLWQKMCYVLSLTRDKGWNGNHVLRLSIGHVHILFSSQASLLRRKPHRTLLPSLFHRCRHFSTTTWLHWTSWTRWVIVSLFYNITACITACTAVQVVHMYSYTPAAKSMVKEISTSISPKPHNRFDETRNLELSLKTAPRKISFRYDNR